MSDERVEDGRSVSGDDSPQDEVQPRQPAAPEEVQGATSGQGSVSAAPGSSRRRRRHRRRHFNATRAIAIGGVAIVAALLFATQFLWSPPPQSGAIESSPPGTSPSLLLPSAAVSGSPPAAGTTAGPSTSPAPQTSPHPVVANRITIARLGIDLPIIEGDGIDAPLGKVSHFPTTSWPGGGSNIYLYAHARDGNFLKLWDAQLGDAIAVTLVDGTQRHYVVSEIRPKVAWNDLSVLDPTPAEQLTLQTCTSYGYTLPRFIVIATPEQ